MSFKLKLLSFALLMSSSITWPMEQYRPTAIGKALSWVSQTKGVHLFGKYVQPIIKWPVAKILGYGDQPASAKYQEWAQEAQTALQIPEEGMIPIKRLNNRGLMALIFKPAGVEEADANYVYEERLDPYPLGAGRSAVHHEYAHTYYRDSAMDTILSGTAFGGTALAAYKIFPLIMPKSSALIQASEVIAAAGGVALLASFAFHSFMEQRADIVGHYATACAQCVQESSNRRRELIKGNNLLLKIIAGYLSPQELDDIAQNLRSQNKLCNYHIQSQYEALD